MKAKKQAPQRSGQKSSGYRVESDAIGPVKVPKDALYGSFTARALANFQISGISAPPEFRIALGLVKKAAAQTNGELGEITKQEAQAIMRAADEFIEGKYNEQFTIDIYQAGAGTPFNMNANEILANRANEILGSKRGVYSPITPNNHVNWAQSTNCVNPTAMRIAALIKLKQLLPEVQKLSKSLYKKGQEFKNIVKIGRTHLQDAVPVTLGQEFQGWGSAIERTAKLIQEAYSHLLEVHIGGTALGTGITAHPKYRPLMVKNLSKLSGFRLKATKYPMELNSNMNAFVVASSSLRCLANDINRISNDLRILTSGPAGGINEISMPEVEPGSSIMPGKVNPSVPECVSMIAFQVIGNDFAILQGAQNSQLELNVMTPMMMHNLIWSMELLTNGCKLFRTDCVDGIKANKERCQELLDKSLCLATGLSAYLGYKQTALLVNEALKKKQSLKQTVLSKKLMSEADLEKILQPEKLTTPQETDKAILKRVRRK